MTSRFLAAGCALVAITAPMRARAADEDGLHPEIVVSAQTPAPTGRIDNPPSTRVTIDAATIATTVNAVSIEDTLKYAPSLVIRKRSIGDNFAPIATRTSGLGSSARSLIYADGALLSALIANNNGNGSPKWNLVAPEEVERIEVLYGPFSAAYAGNSIGAVVNITTRMPDKLEAQATVLFNQQWHSQYLTHLSLPTGQGSVSVGDRLGAFAFFVSATHTVSNAQPITYVTAAALPPVTSGGYATVNRTGGAIQVLGAGDIDHHVEDTIKAKLAWDLTDAITARYTLGLFLDSTRTAIDSYLTGATGDPAYTAAFDSSLYRRRQRHWSHAVSLDGHGGGVDWQVIGTRYVYALDTQAAPTAPNVPPAAFAGGTGAVQDQAGTGWWTLDARGAVGGRGHLVSFGGHLDRYMLRSRTYDTADWIVAAKGARSAASLGDTRTAALWAQDAWTIAPGWTLTLGARQEWWRAWGGFNQSVALSVVQPARTATAFSPKATLAWSPAPAWSVKASFGQAWRFPTVGELYQATTVGTVLANPNPNLAPERARSGELSAEWHDGHGLARLSLFDEVVDGALISQTGSITVAQPGGGNMTALTSFVQNVERTRARGVELAVERHDVVPRVDLSASVTYADAITSRNTAFPGAVGKLLPSVPRWKGNAVVTWRPVSRVSLSAALRFSSRNYASLDNNDLVADTYQGFDRFLVVDLRGTFRLSDRLDVALGVDNVNNDRYFLFHPFPQRSLTASLHWKL